MLKLYAVFSDNALFQCDSTLTLRGKGIAGTALSAVITKDGVAVFEGTSVVSSDGTFALPLATPAGSFDPCTITVTDGTETVSLDNILFGELWLATGQSNMEMPNSNQPECKTFLRQIKDYDIRVYNNVYHEDGTDPDIFSLTPEDSISGFWLTPDDDGLENVSACATAFVKQISDHFAEIGKTVPIGFLNLSWGGTPINAWIPWDVLKEDARSMQYFEKQGRLPIEEKFNQNIAGCNFQQPAVMFNRKIASVRGLKVRGILWYQGENECGIEWKEHIYANFLKLYYDYHRDMFAADMNAFPMYCVLLYPWVYGGSGETMRAYVNDVFVQFAIKEPEKFIVCPIDDLPPVWASNIGNHPIHPAHKYRVGKRLGLLAETNTYGRSGQKTPALMTSYEINGNRILVHFCGGYNLRPLEEHVKNLFIAGEDGNYLPAECEIMGDTLAVFHPHLEHPVHCAYDISSFACGANLVAGDFPVAPFATAFGEEGLLHVEAQPFTNPDITRVWVSHMNAEGSLDIYYHPVWQALPGSEVCQDDAFVEITEGMTHSIRISGEKNPIGASVKMVNYNRFEPQYYSALDVDIYHRETISGYLQLDYAEKDGVSVSVKRPLTPMDGAPYTFKRYTIDLSGLPEGTVDKLTFVFTCDDKRDMPFVNLAKFVLR